MLYFYCELILFKVVGFLFLIIVKLIKLIELIKFIIGILGKLILVCYNY